MFPSGPSLSPKRMVAEVKKSVPGLDLRRGLDWVPRRGAQGRIVAEPHNLAPVEHVLIVDDSFSFRMGLAYNVDLALLWRGTSVPMSC